MEGSGLNAECWSSGADTEGWGWTVFEWGVRVSLSRYSGGGGWEWMWSAGLAELLEWVGMGGWMGLNEECGSSRVATVGGGGGRWFGWGVLV